MDVEKLIKQLRSAAKLEAYYNSEYNGLYNQTADALEKLQTELQKSEHDNVNLTGELEKVAAELEQVKWENDALTEDFVDYVTGGVPNPAMICAAGVLGKTAKDFIRPVQADRRRTDNGTADL